MPRCNPLTIWTRPDRRHRMLLGALRCGTALLLIASARAEVPALADSTLRTSQTSAVACQADRLDFHESTDVNAFRNYGRAVGELLRQEKFDQLDCIADSARTQKARFSGGDWKLRQLYNALEEPEHGVHATEEDWKDHLGRLKRWVAAHPESITARVAFAKAYVGYAWDARGNGYSDTVSDSGWRLFRERLEKARSILEEAAKLKRKCPEWYVVMQRIALGQAWDSESVSALLEKAVAFEPQYQTYYQMYAIYLLPKWRGEDGDSARFAQEAADRVGGEQGDALYFWIAAKIACPCEEPEYKRLSWPRIQKGFEQANEWATIGTRRRGERRNTSIRASNGPLGWLQLRRVSVC
jgi:hypothetical protein